MTQEAIRSEQVMDWRAALWAGIIAGVLFLLSEALLPVLLFGGSPWATFRLVASMVLGEEVLTPARFDPLVVAVAVLLHVGLSVLYTWVLALIIHRGGLLTGILGGALFGLAIYAINYYTFTLFFPWFFSLRSWITIAAHVLFGAVAGGLYEALERDRDLPSTTPASSKGAF
jgi:magnesium-transporting ATPase (P-type)